MTTTSTSSPEEPAPREEDTLTRTRTSGDGAAAQEDPGGAQQEQDLAAAAPPAPAGPPAEADDSSPKDRGATTAPAQEPQPRRTENELREALGLEPLGSAPSRAVMVYGWIATAVTTVVAAVLRLVGLSHPGTLMFDEIYYVKDAYALWTLGYEAQWAEGSDELFSAGDFSGMSTEAAYVVHPQLGKWLIGLGMQLLGPESSAGWRLAPAVAGILTVLLLARLTFRLTRSPVLTGLAGLLLAIDGVALTESRIGLLDMFVGLFATLTMYCLVRDREWSRARLARDLAGTAANHLAPRAHLRPWLWATGLALGLTCSIKWSGLYLLAVVGILVVVWDTLALRRARVRIWFLEGVIGRGTGDFVRLVPTTVIVYLLMWWPWFTHEDSYYRGWTATHAGEGSSWLPDALNDFIHYHQEMYRFHVGLDAEHPYQSLPAGWLLQLRPTSFYWPSEEEMAGHSCGSDHCIQAITSIGNIPIWWAAAAALVVVVLMGTLGRDWRAWVPLAGYLGLYVPWFLYPDRTIFTFYTVAFVPFVVLVVVLGLGVVAGVVSPVPGGWAGRGARQGAGLGSSVGVALAGGVGDADPALGNRVYQESLRPGLVPGSGGSAGGPGVAGLAGADAWAGVPVGQVRPGAALVVVVVVLAVVFAVLWWPIWTGMTVPYDFWRWHMLLDSWI